MEQAYETYLKNGHKLRLCFRKELGLLLKLEREKLGLTESELSHQIQVKIKTIIRMENGLKRIDYPVLCRMLQLYDKWFEIRLRPVFHPTDFD